MPADVSWSDGAFKKSLDAMNRRIDRATMYALREGGRKIKQESRRRAPVYKGQAATYRQVKKAGTVGSIGRSEVVSGLLKYSISSSRKLKVVPGGYSLKVGPRGDRVHLYAGKIEAAQPYMRPGREAAMVQLPAICARAWGRALKR